ncbi:uncharacterized protein LOC123321505 isoform X2 [Coccinella septempunctata]|uniref:uncharacterized protein LOC123321505 isoform X2 n=1 Tax=Coccinella septempunctata TaxID=41139 RepID=UPI001D08159B|nr:uncharacterized protein LOC123321505 isoform X2 [Coccinella septempunctata]
MDSDKTYEQQHYTPTGEKLKIINLDNSRNVFENCQKIRRLINVDGILFIVVSKDLLTEEKTASVAHEINKINSNFPNMEEHLEDRAEAIDLEGFSLVEAIQCLTSLTDVDPEPMILENLFEMSYEDKFKLLEILIDDDRVIIRSSIYSPPHKNS